jgi:hypothetical protein
MQSADGWIEMADSEPIHDNPRNTRNLPAVVQPGEVARPTADSWLIRAIRTLFGWKAGSVRDDLQVVLDATMPASLPSSAPCCATSSICTSAASPTSWCIAPTSSR